MRRWAARAVGPDHADDVVAETFLVAWRRRADLPGETEHLRAWIFVVARHKARHVLDRLGRDAALWAAMERADGEDIAEVVTTSVHAAQVLSELDPADREVLLLVGVEGLGPAEAAAVLGCSPSAMTTRLSRARRRLARRLDAAPEPVASFVPSPFLRRAP